MLSLLLSLAFAGVPEANPGRPSFSDNASPTATGAMEVELGSVFGPSEFGMNYLLKFGLQKRFDLRFGFEHLLAPEFVPGAFSMMVKGTVQKPRDRVLGGAVAPYLDWAPGAKQPGFGSYFILTYPQGDVQVDANLLMDLSPGVDKYQLTLAPVVTVGFPLVDKLGGYGESYLIIPTGAHVSPGMALAFGLGYTFKKNVVFDAAADFGLINRDLVQPWKIQAGVTFGGYLKEPKTQNKKKSNQKKSKPNSGSLR